MHVYVCKHTVYKHLLKGEESRLICIQRKQGLYTLHLTSGRQRVRKQKKNETNDGSDSSLLPLKKEF